MAGIPTEIARRALRSLEDLEHVAMEVHCEAVTTRGHDVVTRCSCPTAERIREARAAMACLSKAILLVPGPPDEEVADGN